jgi:hypothetical protein
MKRKRQTKRSLVSWLLAHHPDRRELLPQFEQRLRQRSVKWLRELKKARLRRGRAA